MEALKSIPTLILAFVALILGVVLIGSVATNTLATTTKSVAANELVTITDARLAGNQINESKWFTLTYGKPYATAWRSDTSGCTLTDLGVTNGSTTLVANTDYVLNTSWNGEGTATTIGDIKFLNTTTTVESIPNTTYVSYSYCPDGYLTQAWTRSVNNLVPGFFALALLIIAVGLFYSVARDNDIF